MERQKYVQPCISMQPCMKACEINGRRFSKSANLQAVEKYTSKQVQVKKGIRIAKNTLVIVPFIQQTQ